MVSQQAIEDLQLVLTKDPSGRYQLPCRKAFLLIRLAGAQEALRFKAQDNVGFRFTSDDLVVEELKTGLVRQQIAWQQVECLAAGEPETDSGALFQG